MVRARGRLSYMYHGTNTEIAGVMIKNCSSSTDANAPNIESLCLRPPSRRLGGSPTRRSRVRRSGGDLGAETLINSKTAYEMRRRADQRATTWGH
jgi:hypothetical protein